jgi:hypothetical protein
MSEATLLVQAIYLWTRDASVPVTEMDEYVRQRLKTGAKPMFSDVARAIAAGALAISLISAEEPE